MVISSKLIKLFGVFCSVSDQTRDKTGITAPVQSSKTVFCLSSRCKKLESSVVKLADNITKDFIAKQTNNKAVRKPITAKTVFQPFVTAI